MIIGLYASMLLSIILLLSAVTNLVSGKAFTSISIILFLLYLPAAHYSGISNDIILFNIMAALVIMVLTLVISAIFANAIPMNIIYLIGSVTPWVGTGKPLFFFLVATLIITITLTLLSFFLNHSRNRLKNPPIGFAIAVATLFYSPFAHAGISALSTL